jgi:RNA polymerase sigma-70 factor (ECF subfamily)
MDDDELIARLAGGDDGALRELFTRYAPTLAARLRAVLPPCDVEDVLQETFLGAWGRRALSAPGRGRRLAVGNRPPPGPAPATPPRARARAAARGAHVGYRRRPGHRAPADPAETVAAQARLASAVSTLSPAEHEVWRLMYVEDRPLAEVAKLTGVPAGTVKSRAHRARRLLRAALGGGLG